MPNTKKYVSLSKLTKYDELLKAKMAADDAAALAAAKKYTDDSVALLDPAGTAATKAAEALASAQTYADNKVKALADGAVADNTAAIAAIKDDANIDSFADVVAELAKKQNTGDYATKAEAQAMADSKNAAIEAAQAAADAAQADATANAQAIEAINHVDTGILATAKSFATTEDAKVQSAVDTLAGKVGTVPEGSTVMGIISNIQENAYDDTALVGRMDAAEGKLTKLIGNDADKSVRTIANEELAAQLIGENAKESLDTLQEIAAWIQSHPDDASAMNDAVVALQNKVDTGDKNVSAYVADAIAALSIGDYAKAADLTALAGRVGNLETESAKHALKTEVEAVSTSLTEYKDAHKDDYTNAQIDAAIKVNTDAIANLNDTYSTDAELDAAIEAEVTRADGAYAAKALEQTVADHKADTVAHITGAERTLWNAALQASDIATGSANGAISVKGADVAVKGLGSAAFTESSAYDAAGAAGAVDGKLTAEVNRATAKENELAAAIAQFVECSEEDINGLFA